MSVAVADGASRHSVHSAQREEYVEYAFLGALCADGWRLGRLVEVARAATDAHGYDVILSEGGITRHVQLKSSILGGKAAHQSVNLKLCDRPGGCVIWIVVDGDTLALQRYGWFGARNGAPLPNPGDRPVRHAKGDATGAKAIRPGLRRLPRGAFDWLDGIAPLFDRMFEAAH